jgi:hypothetical protein
MHRQVNKYVILQRKTLLSRGSNLASDQTIRQEYVTNLLFVNLNNAFDTLSNAMPLKKIHSVRMARQAELQWISVL